VLVSSILNSSIACKQPGANISWSSCAFKSYLAFCITWCNIYS